MTTVFHTYTAQTTCPYCGVGCGVDVQVERDEASTRLTQSSGCQTHPANLGRLCVKGSNLLAANGQEDRLLYPVINGQDADWDVAISQVASQFNQAIEEFGPDSVAFYLSGQILTEDYYVANKLMKGYIGSANVDTNSRLCMSSAVSAYKRAFGEDAVPLCYEDLEQTDLLVLIGSNAAWSHPVLYQRIEKAKQANANMQVVLIDPRRTASAELADLHLPIKPGTDVALFNGLLQWLVEQDLVDEAFIAKHTNGFEQAQSCTQDWSLEQVARYCDVPQSDLARFYIQFGQTRKAISFYSMGVNQSSQGTDKANAIINCHLATGKLGYPGAGPFSITGQPNAMGGREVGGLSTMLAAHMDIDNSEHRETVQTFWDSPRMADKPGLTAVDLFDQMLAGKIKAVWIMATNPLVSLPNRDKVAAALQACPFVVVSDCANRNDTMNYANVLLPASGWSEKNGTVTNSERRISRQRGLLPPPGQAKHDWQAVCEVAKAMGFDQGFNFTHPAQIFAEHCALTGYRNAGQRQLDLSGFADITEAQYDALKPVQWPVNQQFPQGRKRLFEDYQFSTPDKKARFVPVQAKPAAQQTTKDYPFIVNSGRLRDQWHTMTRTGKAAILNRHTDTPFVAVNPTDAKRLGLVEGDIATLRSVQSKSPVEMLVKVDVSQRRGELFCPIHWSATNSSAGAIAGLLDDSTDPVSRQPELKHAAAALEKSAYPQFAWLVNRHRLSASVLAKLDYWVEIRVNQGYVYRIAQQSDSIDWAVWSETLALKGEKVVLQQDKSLSLGLLQDNQVEFVLFAQLSEWPEIQSAWLDVLLEQVPADGAMLHSLLHAEPDEAFLEGPVVCSCFNVRQKTILDAIAEGASTVTALGQKLKCGTNCGSCKSELSGLLAQSDIPEIKNAAESH